KFSSPEHHYCIVTLCLLLSANVLALTLLSSSQGQYESQVQIMGQRLQSSREQKEERELFIYVSPTS
ncbi:hypothetical protein D0Y65_040796, partial [Glycine soja]